MIWNASRSPVTTITGTRSARARSAIEAITSSASKPSTLTLRYPNASTSGSRCGHCYLSRLGRDLLAARRAGVPDDHGRLGAVLGEQLDEHRGEPEDRVRGKARRRGDRL